MSPVASPSRLFGDATLRASFVAIAACGAALGLGAWALAGRNAAFSAAIGAAVAEFNLWVLARIVSALLRNEHVALWIHVALVKMFALFALIGLLMHCAAVTPLSMVVGFCALPMGIAIGSLMSDRKPRSEP